MSRSVSEDTPAAPDADTAARARLIERLQKAREDIYPKIVDNLMKNAGTVMRRLEKAEFHKSIGVILSLDEGHEQRQRLQAFIDHNPQIDMTPVYPEPNHVEKALRPAGLNASKTDAPQQG